MPTSSSAAPTRRYNLLVGRDLQRAHGQPPQAVLTVPLLEGLDGVEKMGKSLSNYVAITEPPDEQFGKLMSIPDGLVGRYAELATDLRPPRSRPSTAAAAGEARPPAGPSGGSRRPSSRSTTARTPPRRPSAASTPCSGARDADRRPRAALPAGDPLHLPAVLVAAGLVASTSEARRQLDAGAVRLDGERVDPPSCDRPRADLAGRLLQVGKRRLARLTD